MDEFGQNEQDLQDEQDGDLCGSPLSGVVIGCAMKVHGILGQDFLESVYQNALLHELKRASIEVESSKRIDVRYDGIIVGEFVADLVVERRLLIENKAVHALAAAHEVQLVNYLTATGIDVGLLLNFGSPRLQVKRKLRILSPLKRPAFDGGYSF